MVFFHFLSQYFRYIAFRRYIIFLLFAIPFFYILHFCYFQLEM